MIKIRNILICLAIVFVATCIFGMSTAQGADLASPMAIEDIFADNNIIEEVAAILGENRNYIVSQAELNTITELLWLSNLGITNIDGLQYLNSLKILDLSDNNISDISALAGLTNLEELDLSFNKIADLSPLGGLTKLTSTTFDAQIVSMKQMLTENGELIIINPLKYIDGTVEMPMPGTISDDGEYDSVTNTITWKKVTAGDTRRFSFNNQFTGGVVVTAFDGIKPTGTVKYSSTTSTIGTVTATLVTSEPIATPAGWTKVNDTTFTKVYNANATETLTITDLAGNINTVAISIANITTESNEELDDEPKAGVVNNIVFASMVSLISLAGIVTAKSKKA